MSVPERWEVRVGDDERHHVVDALRIHLGAGRLTMLEFEERTAQALAARTVGDLLPLTADLPDVRTRPSGPPVRQRPPTGTGTREPWDVLFRIHVGIWAVLVGFFVLLWLLTGAGYFWPIWPALGIGLSVGVHGTVKKAVQG